MCCLHVSGCSRLLGKANDQFVLDDVENTIYFASTSDGAVVKVPLTDLTSQQVIYTESKFYNVNVISILRC